METDPQPNPPKVKAVKQRPLAWQPFTQKQVNTFYRLGGAAWLKGYLNNLVKADADKLDAIKAELAKRSREHKND